MFVKVDPTLKSLINEQGGLVLKITLKRACSFIRDFRVSNQLEKDNKELFMNLGSPRELRLARIWS